jgi:hypothetical protein
MNTDGGLLKVSPDGLLRQSSTAADTWQCSFEGGETATVPGKSISCCSVRTQLNSHCRVCTAGAYIEFAERAVLPQACSLFKASSLQRPC